VALINGRPGWASSTSTGSWTARPPKWETLSPDDKKLFARQAEVYAGYTAHTDNKIGRVIQEAKDLANSRPPRNILR
jgi:arylsulfatase A-like enzyme